MDIPYLLVPASLLLYRLLYEHKTRIEAFGQGILKGEVLLYRWPPVWLVWNQLYDNWQLLFLSTKQTIPKPVRQEVKGTMILAPLVFPALASFPTLEYAVFMVST